jgi:hypothetical protein
MEYQKFYIANERYRPGAFAPVGDFFTKMKSPSGSIFLPEGDT